MCLLILYVKILAQLVIVSIWIYTLYIHIYPVYGCISLHGYTPEEQLLRPPEDSGAWGDAGGRGAGRRTARCGGFPGLVVAAGPRVCFGADGGVRE